MAMVVQHNITAMNASRMLGVTTGQQAKTSEKLASGYRINRAADDAAGLSISEKMRSQIRGLDRASTNAQDGVSAVQTAEGALTEVHSMLQRMNELAVQSANGTNSEVDRKAIQAEVDQLIEEIDRVAQSTKFNETYLLNGDEATSKTVYTYKTIEASVEIAENIELYAENGEDALDEEAVLEALKNKEKLYTTAAIPQTENTVASYTAEKMEATSQKLYSAANTEVTDLTVYFNVEDDGTVTLKDGVTLYTDNTAQTVFDIADVDTYVTVTEESYGITDFSAIYAKGGTEKLSEDEAKALIKAGTKVYSDAATPQTAAVADTDYTYTPSGKATLYDENGKAIAASDLDEYVESGKTIYKDAAKTTTVAENDLGTYTDTATVNGDLTLSLHVGADSYDSNKIEISIESMSAAGIGVNGLKVDTAEDATASIDTIKAAIQLVSNQRSALGAVQNRLEHTIANLDNVVENTTSAESRIRDTDMAEEMVEYSKNNILAQAGQSMLAQANQSTQGVLSLLQ